MLLLAVGVMCLTACAQKKGGERGTRQGGHMVINKDSDSVFVALKQEALGRLEVYFRKQDVPWSIWHRLITATRLLPSGIGCSGRANKHRNIG